MIKPITGPSGKPSFLNSLPLIFAMIQDVLLSQLLKPYTLGEKGF
jgi:hypothetical protein